MGARDGQRGARDVQTAARALAVGDHDDVADDLKREWFAGRAQQIHEEMKGDLDRYMRDLHQGRMRGILAASGHTDDDDADTTAIAAANTFSTAEGVLVAVAMYLARQETKSERS